MPRITVDARLKQVQFTARECDFVYSVALKYLKDEEDALDVAQEALLLAYRNRDQFRGDARFTTWLYRVAATTALMHLRRQRRRPPVETTSFDDEDQRFEPASPGPSPEALSASRQTFARYERGLARLGEKYGRIFHMRFVEGYSEGEIARRLGLSAGTVKTRAYRARACLRRDLAQELERAA
ncbi:MAG TPA: sigma-70 family RNA polymerase sigma factor [Polyangia bacterium]|jgi:RNA polymerase sigma-70 factor (ECF subfamily)